MVHAQSPDPTGHLSHLQTQSHPSYEDIGFDFVSTTVCPTLVLSPLQTKFLCPVLALKPSKLLISYGNGSNRFIRGYAKPNLRFYSPALAHSLLFPVSPTAGCRICPHRRGKIRARVALSGRFLPVSPRFAAKLLQEHGAARVRRAGNCISILFSSVSFGCWKISD